MSGINSGVADNSALLNAYMYLDVQDKMFNNKSLMYSLDYIKDNYPEKAKTEEFKVLQKACDENPSLGNMKIVSQSHYDHKANGKDFFNYSGSKCTDDPIQACAFKDSNGNLYVAYRGTGSRRWGDNGQGYIELSTDMQESATSYFDHVVDEYGYKGNLYVTGHSKGGNEAQYIAMTSKYSKEINFCYSFDGQGFSEKAIEKFENNPNYKEILNKMYSINGDNDPIHKQIGVIIPEENTYYTNTHYTDSNEKIQISYFHNILGMISGSGVDWQKDKYGNITHGKEGWLSKFGETLNDNLKILPESAKGSCAVALMELIDMFKGGSMDDAHADFFDFLTLNNVGIPMVLFTLSEFAVIQMYEKHGVFGALITAIMAVASSFVFLPIIEGLVGLLETVYIIKDIIDGAIKIVDKVKKMCQNAGQWFGNIISNIVSFINNFKDWLFKHSEGYKYASANTYIQINTDKMKNYAGQLSALSSRSKSLDRRMNSLYWNLGIEWDTISNLGRLLKAEVVLDFAGRLDKCASYLNETASDFEKAERDIVGMI